MRSPVPRLGCVALLGALMPAAACGGSGSGGGDGGGGGGGGGGSIATTSAGSGPLDGPAADTTAGRPDDVCAVGASVFDEGAVHQLDMQLAEADWAAMIQEAIDSPEYGGPDKTYFSASLSLDGVPLGSPIAVRLKGHSSLLGAVEQGHAFPFKLDFDRVDASQDLDGLTKVNLHPNLDGITVVNEYLSYGAIRAHGVPTARVGFARVTVNDEALGLYSLVEHVKGKFVRCHYDAPYGDLYKPEEPIGNLAWRGPAIGGYEPEIQFKWPDVSVTDHGSILELLDVANHEPVGSFPAVLDVTEVLTYFAVNVGLGNYDYYASFGHNYYLYESTAGRFTMVPWDMNFSQVPLGSPCGYGRNDEQWPVSNKLLADPTYVQEYLGILEGFLEGAGSPSSLGARIDAVAPILGDDVDAVALEELRASIDLRVQLQLDAIAQGLERCPEYVEDEAEPCDACIDEACDAELSACERDTACACMLECDDEPEAACLEGCGLAATPGSLDALWACVNASCAEACE